MIKSTSRFAKYILLQKGGDSLMKKLLGLSLMLVLFTTMSFAAITQYSFWTTLGEVKGGNQSNGSLVYNPDLNAAFSASYYTGLGSRACILGWSMDTGDPTFGTTDPKYFIRERMHANGVRLGGYKSVYGQSAHVNGSLYFISDRFNMSNLNFVTRLWCPVNSDSVTVTFPNVSAAFPLYNVTGISSTASTIYEDTWGGVQLWAGSTTFTLIPVTCEADGRRVIAPGNQALVGMVGVYTDAAGVGTNFYTGGGYSEGSRTIWCNTLIPGAPVTVYVSGTFGRYNPTTGVIELAFAHDTGTLLFVHVGQLQPSQRGVWKINATTLQPQAGFDVFGAPMGLTACTVANVMADGKLEIAVPPAYPVTDQYIALRDPAGNTSKARLTYTSYGRYTVGPVASISATQVQIDVQGKPASGFYSISTDANFAGQNFWGRNSFADWVAVTDLTKVQGPWGPIDVAKGIWTDATKAGINFFTGAAGDALSAKAGGTGGWWSVSVDTPVIYAAVGGIDTTLSMGSAYVEYTCPAPDGYSACGGYSIMDTTGIITVQIPLPHPTSVWVDYNTGNGIDVANNRFITIAPAANTPAVAVGDTVYACMMYQGGSNPYNFTGPGTAGNRSIPWNPYGVTVDNDGNVFTGSLWPWWGIQAHDSAGNLIARYPIKGGTSTVCRGQISVDTSNGDLYWEDGGGAVWRLKKTGAGLDSYVQDNEPFYLGACLGTAGIVGGHTSSIKTKTVPATVGGAISLVYLTTVSNNNATGLDTKQLTVMRTNGTIDAQVDGAPGLGISYRGMDVTPDGLKVMAAGWADGTYPTITVWSGPQVVPVELSRFETVIN
jgi:hypothetical protein